MVSPKPVRRAVRGGAIALSALASVSLLAPLSQAQSPRKGSGEPPQLSPKPGLPLNAAAAYTVTVNAAQARRAINPEVYGVNYAENAQLRDLNTPLHRMGGNNTSRYNWQQNADNRGNDWFYQSIPYGSATQGERADTFIGDSKSNGSEPMMTIPMVGYVAKLAPGRNKLASFSVSKYGAQQATDWQWYPDAGNGVRTNGLPVTGNDPNDANTPADHNFMKPWIQQMVTRWGPASGGGLRYYIYDNEYSIWHSTHRDVHPTGARMSEVRDKIVAYGTMIRSVDPSALLVGPEEWGWSGYFYSGYDLQYGNNNGWGGPMPDRTAIGNMDAMPWLLSQLRQHETQTGVRLLDVFSLHYYPQGNEFSDDTSTAMQQRRNRSTRSLWDPSYTDETWIGDRVQLIPRMKGWVNSHYPGLRTGITEYSWGADGHINGATTQADILGIFGREGLDMGTRWVAPATSTPTYKAMKMYRNYDGSKSGFGETSIQASSTSNADDLSAFASVRAKDGALTVMIVSKALSGSNTVTVNLQNFAPGTSAQVWQLTSANAINRLADTAVTGSSLGVTVPQQSVTLVVIPPAPTGLVKAPALTLEKFQGDATGITARVELRQPGTRTVVETQNVALLSPGALYFPTTRRGTFDITIQGGTFLRKKFANVSIDGGGALLPLTTLKNGDANGDNVVAGQDAAVVARAVGSTAGSANWNPKADLNGDGRVSQADYDIVLANYRARGDE